jgi:hypothetical protein
MRIRIRCKSCDDIVESKRGGDYQVCKCGKSYVDRDRWYPNTRCTYGGDAELIKDDMNDE